MAHLRRRVWSTATSSSVPTRTCPVRPAARCCWWWPAEDLHEWCICSSDWSWCPRPEERPVQSDKLNLNTCSIDSIKLHQRYAALTSTTMPSCSGPTVFRDSLLSATEYSHSRPFSIKVLDVISSPLAFKMKLPVTWFLTAEEHTHGQKRKTHL